MENITEISTQGDASVLRLLLSGVPILGPVINEVIEIRGRIKQDRLNKFIEILATGLTGKTEINDAILKTEDFIDLFESVIKRVVQTKSEAKHKRYRDILIKQIENNFSGSDKSDRHLELIATLNEAEIFILFSHKVFDENFLHDKEELNLYKKEKDTLNAQLREEVKLAQEGSANNTSAVKLALENLNERITEIKAKLDDLNIYREAKFYNVPTNEFNYYKQNLYSKALLVDIGIGTFDHIPFSDMVITEFGKEFLRFLMSEK
jgi:hypothetical protein